jgi:carbamate kinase
MVHSTRARTLRSYKLLRMRAIPILYYVDKKCQICGENTMRMRVLACKYKRRGWKRVFPKPRPRTRVNQSIV